ncbi:hypothetical protein J6590_095586 [Homalodisca vitripennis]|nr:hypothetical protein J6590_065603 [Homalodisca vitripennis]KAG8324296.1 hypothetical protein J6590_095586 [Homalodisca vitripennis]
MMLPRGRVFYSHNQDVLSFGESRKRYSAGFHQVKPPSLCSGLSRPPKGLVPELFIIVEGLATLMREMTTCHINITEICKPGAGQMLDVALSLSSSSHKQHGYLLLAGTIDLAAGVGTPISRNNRE